MLLLFIAVKGMPMAEIMPQGMNNVLGEGGATVMAKRQAERSRIADAALRRQVAQWVREALGELVKEHESESDRLVATASVMRYSTKTSGSQAGERGYVAPRH